MRPLTPKALEFAKAIARQSPLAINAAAAAVSVGYAKNSAKVTACRMLKDARVIAAVANARAILAGKPPMPTPPPPQPKTQSKQDASTWPFPNIDASGNPILPPQAEDDEPPRDLLINVDIQVDDPLDFLKMVMNNPRVAADVRKDAAKAMLPYVHAKKGETGKKDEKDAAAKKVSAGRFAGAAPPPKPKLVSSNA